MSSFLFFLSEWAKQLPLWFDLTEKVRGACLIHCRRLFFLTFYIVGELRLHKRCHLLSLWYDNGQKHCGAKANARDIYKSFIFNLICTIWNSKHLQNPPSDAPLYCIYASIINYAVHFIAFTTTAFSLYFMLRISMPCFYLHVKCLRWFV